MSTTPQNSRWIPPPVEYLVPLDGAEMSRWELAPGDIFVISPSGKILRLKRAGDVLEAEWRHRYAHSRQLRLLPLVNADRVEKLCSLFAAWKDSEDPEEREVAAASFIDAVKSGMGFAGGLTMLDWAIVCHTLFKPDAALVEEFQVQHVVLYRRGLLVSSLSVLFAMACGYRDPNFLGETYRTAWYLDAGLIDESFTYWVALACQAERLQPGEGGKFLRKHNVSEAEYKLFLNHPHRSHERASSELASDLEFPELLLSILHHHEKSDGSGFPEKMHLSVLSDWEALMVLADSMVDYREEMLEKNLRQGWGEIWKAYTDRPVLNLPIQSVVKKLLKWMMTSSIEKEVAA